MRKLLPILLTLVLASLALPQGKLSGGVKLSGGTKVSGSAGGGGGTITFVQSAQGRNGAGSAAVAFTSNNTAGNLSVVGVQLETSTATITSVTDTLTNTYTAVGTLNCDTSAALCVQIYYAKNIAAGANTVTVARSAGAVDVLIHEYSGASTTTPLDASAQANSGGTQSTNLDSGAMTATGSTDLIFGLAGSPASITVGSGFTQRESLTFNVFFVSESKAASGTGNYNATATISNNHWAMSGALFK